MSYILHLKKREQLIIQLYDTDKINLKKEMKETKEDEEEGEEKYKQATCAAVFGCLFTTVYRSIFCRKLTDE